MNDDLISRQAAIDAVSHHGEIENDYTDLYHDGYCDGIYDSVGVLECLPPAQPEPHWIPCRLGLPPEAEPVNVTWINRDPEPYYVVIKDKPFTATAVYFDGKWYWWSATCPDMLAEYGHNEIDEVDDRIDIVAWMQLPKPYSERRQNERH